MSRLHPVVQFILYGCLVVIVCCGLLVSAYYYRTYVVEAPQEAAEMTPTIPTTPPNETPYFQDLTYRVPARNPALDVTEI